MLSLEQDKPLVITINQIVDRMLTICNLKRESHFLAEEKVKLMATQSDRKIHIKSHFGFALMDRTLNMN